MHNVTVRNSDGNAVLENINLEIPAGARVAVQSSSQIERRAFAELLVREALPAPGDYVPRRELALGGKALRLVQISPERDGLKLLSWQLGEGR